MSDNVERLAKVVKEVCDAESRNTLDGGSWRRIAGALLANGVTLPTPPRATPLEAAAREDAEQAGLRWEDLSAKSRAIWMEMSAKRITAAVGALSDEECRMLCLKMLVPDQFRAALLARLTEGGAA